MGYFWWTFFHRIIKRMLKSKLPSATSCLDTSLAITVTHGIIASGSHFKGLLPNSFGVTCMLKKNYQCSLRVLIKTVRRGFKISVLKQPTGRVECVLWGTWTRDLNICKIHAGAQHIISETTLAGGERESEGARESGVKSNKGLRAKNQSEDFVLNAPLGRQIPSTM